MSATAETCGEVGKPFPETILNTINTPKKELIERWLKAGFSLFQRNFPQDKGNKCLTQTGTPQGGVISPLLANIGWHGARNTYQNNQPKAWHHSIRR